MNSRAVAASLVLLGPASGLAQSQQLDPDTAIRLPELRVQASRLAAGGIPVSRAPFAVQIISGEELAGARPLTLADALARLPGVTAADVTGSDAQPTLTLRGYSVSPVMGVPQGVGVFVDGVRVNEPDASQVHFDLIPLADVERVEVLRGPTGPFGKNSLGGAVNLTTRRGGSRPGTGAELAAGSFGRAGVRAYTGGERGRFDYYASGRYLRSDGWRDGAFTRLATAFAKVGWRGGGTDLWLSYTLASDSILQAGGIPASWLAHPDSVPVRWRGGDPRTINFTAGDYFAPRLHFLNAHLSRELGRGLRLGANAFVRRTRIAQFNANFTEPDTRIATRTRTVGVVVQLAYERRGLTLLGGGELSASDVEIRIFEHPNESFPDLPHSGSRTEDVGTREDDRAAYLQARLAATARLALTASLRHDHVRLPFRDFLEPENGGNNVFRQLTGSIAADYALGADLVLFAGYGRGFRAPVLLELACADPEDPCPLPYELGADPPLAPVTTDTWQAGVRWVTGSVSLELVAYWAEVYDDIFSVQPAGARVGYFQNLDRTRRQGVELSGVVRPSTALELRSGVALTRATFQTTATLSAPFLEAEGDGEVPEPRAVSVREPPTVRPGDGFPMVPGLTAHLGASWSRGPWQAEASFHYVGAQWLPGNEDNAHPGARLTPYALVEASASRRLGPVKVQAFVRNLLDVRYETFGVLALNRLNDADAPRVEPFLTPGLPRQIEVSLVYSTR